jgi:hypothetical protein
MKIYHALKETSYPTDIQSMTGTAAIATTIGNYFFDPITNCVTGIMIQHSAFKPSAFSFMSAI